MEIIDLKVQLIDAGKESVKQLIAVASEDITKRFKFKRKQDEQEEDYVDRVQSSMDKLKQVASTKRMAMFDAFDILNKIEEEERNLKVEDSEKETDNFAERRARG